MSEHDWNGWKILTGLRNADDIIRDINSARKLDLANLFFRSDLRKMFGEASQETGLLLPSSLSAFDLSDILSLGAFYISVMQADSRYIQALEEVVSTYPRVDIDPTLEGLWSATQKTMIRQAANPIIDNYHAVLGEDDFLPSLAVKISELISQNLVSSTIKYLSFSSPQVLALKAASFVLDRFAKTKEKVTAIREMVLNIQIQATILEEFRFLNGMLCSI